MCKREKQLIRQEVLRKDHLNVVVTAIIASVVEAANKRLPTPRKTPAATWADEMVPGRIVDARDARIVAAS